MVDPDIIGVRHFDLATKTTKILQAYKNLEDIIAILGMDELSAADQETVMRARKIQRFMSQPFQVAEIFTGMPGKFCSLEDTLSGFERILNGELDDVPEVAFYMVGNVDEVIAQAEEMAATARAQDLRSGVATDLTEEEKAQLAAEKTIEEQITDMVAAAPAYAAAVAAEKKKQADKTEAELKEGNEIRVAEGLQLIANPMIGDQFEEAEAN